jgi:hypothetical protein
MVLKSQAHCAYASKPFLAILDAQADPEHFAPAPTPDGGIG